MGVVWGGAKRPMPPPSRRVPAITPTSCSGDNAPRQVAVSRTRPVCVCVCVCVCMICCTYLNLKYIATDGGRVCATRPTWATSGSRRSSACAASATCSGGGRQTIPPLHLSSVCVCVCVCSPALRMCGVCDTFLPEALLRSASPAVRGNRRPSSAPRRASRFEGERRREGRNRSDA